MCPPPPQPESTGQNQQWERRHFPTALYSQQTYLGESLARGTFASKALDCAIYNKWPLSEPWPDAVLFCVTNSVHNSVSFSSHGKVGSKDAHIQSILSYLPRQNPGKSYKLSAQYQSTLLGRKALHAWACTTTAI